MADENLTANERDLLAKAKWQLMREDCPHEWPQHIIDLLTRLGEARAALDISETVREMLEDDLFRRDIRIAIAAKSQAQAAEGRGG